MVYPSKDGHPFDYSPNSMLINFIDETNIVNHYTTPPAIINLLCADGDGQGTRNGI